LANSIAAASNGGEEEVLTWREDDYDRNSIRRKISEDPGRELVSELGNNQGEGFVQGSIIG